MEHITIGETDVEIIRKNTVIVGSGAAGLNAADRLYSYGQHDIAIVTEGLLKGTSRNTGSDKQTYYKLNLSGGEPDSVVAMAETLYNGGAMDGDIALCEAALSAQCFYRLAEIGVPFPHNEYGEYVGYKTDHDPRARASSAGPLTSKYMTEKLLEQVQLKNIPIYDGYMAIKILVQNGACHGVLCLNLNELGLMSRPKILMLDEPSLGLAPIVSKMIFDIIREINRAGTTVLLVEQNAHAALEVADYAYVLETGVITMENTGKFLLDDDSVRKAYLGEV